MWHLNMEIHEPENQRNGRKLLERVALWIVIACGVAAVVCASSSLGSERLSTLYSLVYSLLGSPALGCSDSFDARKHDSWSRPLHLRYPGRMVDRQVGLQQSDFRHYDSQRVGTVGTSNGTWTWCPESSTECPGD